MSDDKDNPLGLHFEHEWEREAWNAEREALRQKRMARKATEDEAQAIDVGKLLSLVKPTLIPDEPNECPLPPYRSRDAAECCDRIWHYRTGQHGYGEAFMRCPVKTRAEREKVYEHERERLAGELALIERSGSIGFDGFDSTRCVGASTALFAVQEFAKGRPPKRNVFLAGTTGLGKTRLLLASHFALLKAGVRSVYVTSPELREAFDDQRAFDEDIRNQGAGVVERLVRTQAVHLDDLGNVENDERKRGLFAEGLKRVLDRSGAAWLAATNLTWAEASKHPDVGEKVLSRLVNGALVVKLEGADFRIEHSQRAK